MRISILVTAVLAAPSLFAEARIAKSTATTPQEVVKWTAGVSYTYDPSGNIRQIGADRFAYDHVGRLTHAEINGAMRTYRYDAFGNRIECNHMPGTESQSDCQFDVEIDSESNRMAGMGHDSRGNVTAFAGHTYSYDEAGMTKRDDGGGSSREFIYTAGDERLAIYSVGRNVKWTVRDLNGQVLREFTSDLSGSQWTWTTDYVYRDGLLLSSRHVTNETPVTHYYHLDHLGTPRRVTDHGNRTVGFHDYFAFGPEVPGGKDEPNATSFKYTGHERDESMNPSGLETIDYMHARYYSPALGRFLQIDPIFAPGAEHYPQVFNRYSYALNNPLVYVDPTGMVMICFQYKSNNEAEPKIRCIETERIEVSARMPRGGGSTGGGSSGSGGSASPNTGGIFDSKPMPLNCNRIPPMPPNLSLAGLRNNIADAYARQGNLPWLVSKVKPGGQWDYKRSDTAAMQAGTPSRYEDFGNFHYGVVFAAAGIPKYIAHVGAGVAQEGPQPYFLNHWVGNLAYPYGDDPGDIREIDNGYRFYDQCIARNY